MNNESSRKHNFDSITLSSAVDSFSSSTLEPLPMENDADPDDMPELEPIYHSRSPALVIAPGYEPKPNDYLDLDIQELLKNENETPVPRMRTIADFEKAFAAVKDTPQISQPDRDTRAREFVREKLRADVDSDGLPALLDEFTLSRLVLTKTDQIVRFLLDPSILMKEDFKMRKYLKWFEESEEFRVYVPSALKRFY